MIDHAMPGPLFEISLWIHIISGTIGAIVIFPLLLFGPKDRRHRRWSKWAIIDTWVILIFGGLLLLDPLFLVYWKQLAASISTMRHHYVHVFANAQEAWLFFVYLDVLLAYLVFTGAGVWTRVRRGNRRDGYPPRKIDVILTLGTIALTINMIVVGFMSWSSNRQYAILLLGSGFAMSIIFVFDLRTWIDRGRRVRSWWSLHAVKMSIAWAALVYAVFLRWRAKSTALENLTSVVALAVIIAIVIAMALYSARLHRKGKLAHLLNHLTHHSHEEPSGSPRHASGEER